MKKSLTVVSALLIGLLALSGCAATNNAPQSAESSVESSIAESSAESSATESSAEPEVAEEESTPAVQSEAPVSSSQQESPPVAAASSAAETPVPAASSSETEAVSSSEASTASASFSLEDAKTAFSAQHPGADIQVAKLEGNAYYIEGWEGNTLYKMKFSTTGGEVLLDKTITTGRP
ncbi:MAG: hypothetical protein ACK5LX_04580 [Oscillospiraceae bacterium]